MVLNKFISRYTNYTDMYKILPVMKNLVENDNSLFEFKTPFGFFEL